jgi:hypothetical protein
MEPNPHGAAVSPPAGDAPLRARMQPVDSVWGRVFSVIHLLSGKGPDGGGKGLF